MESLDGIINTGYQRAEWSVGTDPMGDLGRAIEMLAPKLRNVDKLVMVRPGMADRISDGLGELGIHVEVRESRFIPEGVGYVIDLPKDPPELLTPSPVSREGGMR